jgi:hypothetical protein
VRLELLPALVQGAHQPPTPVVDVAIRARREAYAADFAALRRDVTSIVSRLGAVPRNA